MIRKYILRLFITATIILSNNLYAQEDEITNDIKEHCTSFIINYKDINELLKENGHAYEYHGEKKKVFGG